MDGQPCDFTGKTKMEKIIMKIMFFLGRILGVLALVLMFNTVAKADGKGPNDRRRELCYNLGYNTGFGDTCDFDYVGDKIPAEITLIVDENTDEPNKPASEEIPSGMLQIKFLKSKEQFTDIYLPIKDAGGGVYKFYWYEEIWASFMKSDYACLTAECTKEKAENGFGAYTGVSEEDLYDLKNLREHKLPYQVASDEMQIRIQQALNTQAVPIITDVKSVELVSRNKDNSGATIFKANVVIRLVKDYGVKK